MSKISLKPNSAGSANFEIAAPATNVDRTFNLPDEAGTVLTDVSDIESQVKTATNATGSAPIYACRSWVNFDGTGTVSIRESGNVSSITDHASGQYTANFSTAIPDSNYAAEVTVTGALNDNSFQGYTHWVRSTGTSGVRVHLAADRGGSFGDAELISVTVFR